eukprot:scaffold267356_cov35-Tisochrysis_lutea.AAC.5
MISYCWPNGISLDLIGHCSLAEAAVRRRKPKNRLPLPANVEARPHPASARALRRLGDMLWLGPFNTLAGSVVQDLEGFAFGSNQHNSAKV